jgi:hypothetical protein
MEKIRMKKQILTVVATLALLVPMAIIGFAGLNSRVRATIPFDFNVGGKQLKAGKYVINQSSITMGTLIRNLDDNDVANFNSITITDRAQQAEARLVFRRYGNQYFLGKIYDGTSGQGIELPRSKAEREASKKRDTITQNLIQPVEEVVVASIGR